MGRQRIMAQMKEQIKTPEKELNKMEISNLSDAEVKTLVIRMLKELSGYLNSIKETQAEMKDILTEIKNNLQRINSGMHEAKNQIYDLEHKEAKTTNQNKKKKESKKNEDSISSLWDNFKHANIHITRVSEGERARNWKPI